MRNLTWGEIDRRLTESTNCVQNLFCFMRLLIMKSTKDLFNRNDRSNCLSLNRGTAPNQSLMTHMYALSRSYFVIFLLFLFLPVQNSYSTLSDVEPRLYFFPNALNHETGRNRSGSLLMMSLMTSGGISTGFVEVVNKNAAMETNQRITWEFATTKTLLSNKDPPISGEKR